MDKKGLLLAVLLFIGGTNHFFALNHPSSIVFDEVHFGRYVSSYCCTGSRFFDIHPPHGKLIIAGAAKLLGFEGKEDFGTIGKAYQPGSAFALRFMPALVGTLIPLSIFLLLCQLGASLSASFFGALLFLFDNALLVQTRIIALDGFLVIFTLTALSVFLFAMERVNLTERLLTFALSGCLASLAVGTKFTGLVALALPGVVALVDCLRNASANYFKRWLLAGTCFMLGAVAVYLAGWVLHFQLLTEPGPGDKWGEWTGYFFTDFVDLHSKMLSANDGLTATHPDASPWWSWPLMLTPVFYWSKDGIWIYLLGNPVVWWGMSILFVAALVNCMLIKASNLSIQHTDYERRQILWIPLVAYCVAYFPFVAISRVLFLYHYFTPLIFSSLFVVLWLDSIGWTRQGGIFRQRPSYFFAIILLIIGFVAISPVTFGIHTDADLRDEMFEIFPAWR